ncbi:LOW QUALITY PROTEIN: carboxypeptidase O [Octodon degus]|uniref:LOW QUALITY PROTEIN: carboxypeptidase O n=1 Tax=Octodon degus TaxID=10160 RepID=A0A6P3FZH9_OCTDE|nr:LOW QUALITY PROTEIN: carboxypeptidase O [Octodon degus]
MIRVNQAILLLIAETHWPFQIQEWMGQVSESCAEVVTQHFLGVTYESQPCIPLQISQPSSNPKKIIWMHCGTHAGECITSAFCQWFVKEVCLNHSKCSSLKFPDSLKLPRQLDFYVLPALNRDSYNYTWKTDRQWRKSHSSHNKGIYFGSDLNRNFNISRCSIGTSKNCQDVTFCGAGPKSQLETKGFSNLLESRKEEVVCFLTTHSYGQLIFVQYGYTTDKSSNHQELIQVGQKAANAQKVKHGTNYRVGSSADILYATSELSRDGSQDIKIPFSYTFKLRDSGTHAFVLPKDQIQTTYEKVLEAVLSILDDMHANHWLSSRAWEATGTSVVVSPLWFFTSPL